MPVAITPTFSPWAHTSDDSYIYQLSLVLATATVSYYPICKFQSLFPFWIACDIPNIEVDTKKQVARHNQPNVYFEVHTYTHTTNNTTRLLIISCNNIVFTITTALYAGSVYHVLLISCLLQSLRFMRVI